MNTIRATLSRSNFALNEHLIIELDSIPLDALIATHTGNDDFDGFVPSLLNWMESALERKLTWDRIKPEIGQTQNCPILICPDDLDFNCTVIVASISRDEEYVTWNRFGLDCSHSQTDVGTRVDWFPGLGPYVFTTDEYDTMLSLFRKLHNVR
ncbi:hypothetical protein SH449x_005245 [Pirellulaceae bacterium SH449]